MKNSKIKTLTPAIMGAILVAGGFTAAAISATTTPIVPVKVGENLGTDQMAIAKKLKNTGFSDFEFETEDDEIEVEAIFENAEVEIEISMETGNVISVEIEDEEENDD